jgi:hypothetical protein
MRKALVAVDGSDNSLGAVRHVIKLVQDREPLEIHLLNVQPPLHGDVTMFVAGSVVRSFHGGGLPRHCAGVRSAGSRRHTVRHAQSHRPCDCRICEEAEL